MQLAEIKAAQFFQLNSVFKLVCYLANSLFETL
jgi:hypothetical protein